MIKYFVTRKFRGTYPYVKMLKGFMVKERLGTHVLCDARACYVKSIPKLIYLNELGQCILILASSSTPVFNQSASYL